ncbi:MAG: glycosyltransferase [Patescibacteria group bacterium]|nr:glycosyltransferase [Patescibacteria group bacterium]
MAQDSLSGLKIALAQDWLTNQGGAERVLYSLHKLFPEAPIYTTVYDRAKTPLFQNCEIHTSYLQNWPLSKKHQFYPHMRPRAIEQLDFRGFDIVISTSSAEMKGIITKPETMHISYLHTPTRYYWDQYHEYFDRLEFGLLNPMVRLVMPMLIHKLRQWDFLAAQRPDYLLANSHNSANRVTKYYRREAEVIYPPIQTEIFKKAAEEVKKQDYFIYFSRLNPYKRADLAVLACAKLNLPLKVIGVGPELPRLKNLAGHKTEFLGWVSDDKLPELVAGARAFIFPALEDFGIVPLEAAAAGVPTIAFGQGGSLETVKKGVSGEFFYEQSVDAVVEVLSNFDSNKYSKEAMQKWADEFSEEIFQKKFKDMVARKWDEWCNKKRL